MGSGVLGKMYPACIPEWPRLWIGSLRKLLPTDEILEQNENTILYFEFLLIFSIMKNAQCNQSIIIVTINKISLHLYCWS